MTQNMHRRNLRLAALLAIVLSTNAIHAANRLWTSTSGGIAYWQTNTAWSGGIAPVAGDDLLFTSAPVSGGTRTVINDFAPNTQFNSISLINLYNLSGNAINLAGNVTNNASGAIATINLNTSLQQDSTWFIGVSNGRIDVNGDISGSYGLVKAGAGNLRLQTATKTYSGNTTVDGGTLDLNIANALPSGVGKGNVTVNGGATLGLRFGQNINGLNGNGTVQALSSGTKVLTLGNGDASGSFTGTIVNGSGTVALTKVGTGIQTLNGTIGYSGATIVNDGSLYLNSVLISSSTVTVGAAGTIGGTGAVLNALGTTTVNGTIDPGGAAGLIGSLGFGGNLILNGSSTGTFQLDRNVGSDLLSVSSGLTLGGTWNVFNTGSSLLAGDAFDLFNAGSLSGSVTALNLPALDGGLGWDTSLFATSGVISVVVVPEPSAASMMLMGLAGLAFVTRFRRK